ncbi:MAG: DUF6443 domain-containing protein, partial [Odoribacteraceae bacterium]|nr:DUF6443 domain-containing protein [Odoribacteraceae bacterium]
MKQIFLGLALSMLVLGTAGQGLDNITAFSPSPLVLSGKSQFASVSFTYNGDLHQYPMEQMSQDIFDKFFQEISFCMIPFGAEYTDDQHGVWYFIVLENCDMEAREVHLSLANAELSIIQHSYYAPNIYSVSGSTFKSVNTPCTVTLSGSQSGVTYTLLRDGTPVGSKTGTGSALNFTNVHDFGDYTVRAANDHNLTTLMDGVAKVYPIINVYSLSGGGSLTIESGLPLSLSGSQSGIVYNLLKDNTLVNTRNGTGTAITFTVNEPGSYRVQAIHKERVVAMNGVVTVTLSSSGAFGITGFSPSTIEIPMFACILQIQVSHAENMPTITSYEMLEELSACLTSSDGITLLFISFTGNHSGTLYLFVDQNDTGITRAFQLAIPYKATLTIEQTASTDFKVFTLSGGGNISDNTGCDITLSGSQAGVTYKLLKNGNICNTLLGTGLPLVFTGIYTPGIYTVQAQAYTNNGEYTCMMAGSATVYVQLDSYTLSGGGNITNNAPNVTLALSGSQAGVTYKLLRHGESHATRSGTGNALEFTVNLPGEYSVMAITSGDNLLMNGTALVTGKIFSKNKNYTVTTTYLDPTTTTAAPRSIVDVVYTNGHGQPVQEVMVAAAPGGKDIVRPVEHARFGREERIFLPYSAISGGGTFLGNATDTARWAADYGNEEKAFAYTRVTYDDSPLNRVIGQIGAGKAWHVARKGITTTYMTNTANEVPLWRVNENGELSFDGHYPAGTLLKEAVTDEDGNAGETFKDKEGNVVLSARYDNANDNERHVTCNVYDDFGLLRYVLPPAVADASDLSMETIDEYCYAYKHDEKKRLIEKKLPGVAPVYMLYDARDRLALSQDGNQRAGNEWLYTLYDTFNRVVESGTCVSDAPVESLRATVGTSCNYIPGTRTALLENFYDHYGPEALPFEAARDISGHADGDGNPNGYHDLVASMITTTRERVLDDDGSNWVT